ncbi:MAG: hypothetical protein EXR81_05345 [Gammaproteobacteria bacterium]|nr:hypothetical protein [Gammaproteobacteria bacterium]
MHHAPAATAAEPIAPMLKIAENFQLGVITWLTQIEGNPALQQTIQYFLRSGDDAVKLTKKQTSATPELLLSGFTILRMFDANNNTVFRIVGHHTIGEPGGFGRVKIALPLEFNPATNEITCRTFLPVALKIIRIVNMDSHYEPTPSPTAHFIFRNSYSDSYAYNARVTESKKSRYADSSSVGTQCELQCNEKKYVSMRLFHGADLYDLVTTYSMPKNGLGLSKEIVCTIILGILTRLDELHKKNIVHRDVKLENILVNLKTWEINLIDYDNSAPNESELRVAGTPEYHHEDIKKRSQAINKLMTVDFYDDLYAFAVILDSFAEQQLLCPADEVFNDRLIAISESIKFRDTVCGSAANMIGEINRNFPGIICPATNPEQFPLAKISKTISLGSIMSRPNKRKSHELPSNSESKKVMDPPSHAILRTRSEP